MKWREIGDTSLTRFLTALDGTPLHAEGPNIYHAVKPHSILYLAHLKHESNFGREGIAADGSHNPTGLRPRGGSGFMRFTIWAAAAHEWKIRVTDPNYAYATTATVDEYVHVYAPASDGNNEREYVAIIEAYARDYGKAVPMATVVYGNVPRPAMIEMIVPKPWEGAGFDRVAPRKIVGTCNHRTEGRDTPRSVHDLFATGGERQFDALTDYVIGTDGTIGHLNDERGTRAGWANGGSDGLEGDGPNFVKTFGIVGINSRLASIEHCGLGGDPITPEQFSASARLNAWIFDQCHVPWDSFPVHPAYGIVTQLEHWEFATKGCPGTQFRSRTDELHQAIRGLLKAGQMATVPTPVPPPTPIEVAHGKYPEGMDEALATKFYDTLIKRRVDGSVTTLSFQPKSAVSLAWLARGKKENAYPAADTWIQFKDSSADVREMVTFKNGWVLWRPNERSGWKWL